MLWGRSSTEPHEKQFQKRTGRPRGKRRFKADTRKRERSGRRRRSSLKPAEETEEEEDQEVASSTTQEVAVSPQKSVLSEEMGESREGSVPGLEEMQVDRDSSLRSPPNQASVLAHE